MFRPLPLPSKDLYFKAFGPKDPIIYGFWAILMPRVKEEGFISSVVKPASLLVDNFNTWVSE